ncbi:MAG: hypothetical protein PHE27_07665 [Alphaproteobacteria bacterium]|nr:hypothetical protein [Alphaproteobacteria bacterium]
MPEYFIFEIAKWEPYYLFSLSADKHKEEFYSEYAGFEIKAICIFPEKLKGREATFDVTGRRDGLMPLSEHTQNWEPKGVGELELSPTYGRFYTSIPQDSLDFMSSSFSQGHFRFILLYGPSLKRSKSLCTEMQFKQSVDLEDY